MYLILNYCILKALKPTATAIIGYGMGSFCVVGADGFEPPTLCL